MPLIDLPLEMSPLDEGFRRRFDRIRDDWLKSVIKSLKCGQKAGTVGIEINVRKAATQILTFLIGSMVLAKGAQILKLFRDCQSRLMSTSIRFVTNTSQSILLW